MDNNPKIDESKLTEEQRNQLDKWKHDVKSLRTLEDIATMAQEMLGIMDTNQKDPGRKTLIIDHVTGDDFVKILSNMQESLQAFKEQKEPTLPDYATPVVSAVSKLEKALSASIKAIDVKPSVSVDAPNVHVDAPSVDLRGVEKVLKDMPKAFKDAIKLIPQTEIPEVDQQPLIDKLGDILEQLGSIDTATRMKPQAPATLKVTNPDGTPVGSVNSGNLDRQQTTITSSTAETTIANAVPSKMLGLYGLILTNTSATATKVTIKDAIAGTTRMVFQVPATDTRGFMVPADSAHPQAGPHSAWTATCGTSVASIEVTAMYIKS